MRIIEYGHIKPDIAMCGRCGCKFEYVSFDIKQMKDKFVICCPVCGKGKIVAWVKRGE